MTYKLFVSVVIQKGQSTHFGDSVGLMGHFEMGQMLARDGETVLDDPNTFGDLVLVTHASTNCYRLACRMSRFTYLQPYTRLSGAKLFGFYVLDYDLYSSL
jgi:hypothetical protein